MRASEIDREAARSVELVKGVGQIVFEIARQLILIEIKLDFHFLMDYEKLDWRTNQNI